jgi:hypothetical protein
MNKKELKETLDTMGIDYPSDATNNTLQLLIESNNNPSPSDEEDYENATPDDDVSGEGDSSNSVAPDLDEAPDYIGTAELKSQVSANSDSDGFIDPNWGDK